jgi:nucleoside-diphosphate-sugar epimerase
MTSLLPELSALGAPRDNLERVLVAALPPSSEMDSLFSSFNFQEVVHCAGSLSYHDEASLQAGNIDLTRSLVESARQTGVQRFTYVSTAFASGLMDEPVPETLFEGRRSDPAAYMRSKRDAEWIVAKSGIPYLILRPAIVIGDSRDGRYPGKPFGLYQVWHSAERFATYRYMPVIHAIAPRIPLQVVHQDAFQSAFLAAFRHQRANSVVHIAGDAAELPTVRDLWDLWLMAWARPEEVHYYERLDDVPLDGMDRDQRLFVQFAAANIEISTHAWRFETRNLDALSTDGLEFVQASKQSVALCQDRFIAGSARIQRFLREHSGRSREMPKIFDHAIA